MALKPLNSVAGFSVGETPSNVIYANGDVTANNFIATAKSNLGPIGNVFVSGGSNGQVVQTDGAGNLSFVTIDTWKIQNGNSNVQVLANSNVTVTISGNANIATFSTLGLDVNGYVQVQGNVIANGNVSANNYIVTPGSTDLIVAPGSVLTRFYSDVNPYSDGGYDLGNGLARWNNVFAYYSNVEGNVDINDTLTVSSNVNFTSAGNVSLGPVGNLHITGGSNGQVLQTDGAGNLTWSSTANISEIHNGNSNVEIPVTNGNVYINANSGTDQQWNFDTSGFLTTPFGGQITNNYDNGNVTGQLMLANGAGGYANGLAGLNQGGGNNTIYLTDSGIEFYSNSLGSEQYWHFDGSGNTSFPSVGSADLGNFVTANYANFRNDLVVQGNIANANNITVTNNITTDTANVTGNLVAGNVDGGNLVKANNFSTNGSGGDITLTGGNVQGANVTFSNSFTANSGAVDFSTTSNVALGDVANVHITGGTSGYLLTTDGTGNLSWSATASTTEIFNGNSNVSIPIADGNVYINANAAADQQWNFTTDGNLILPLGGIITEGSSPSGVGNTISLTPSGGTSANQQLLIYPTIVEGDHLHLTTGNLSVTSLFLGNDNQYIRTNTDGSMIIGTDDTFPDSPGYGYRWVFDAAGNLTAPGNGIANLGNLVTANYANFLNDVVVQGNIANANNISVTYNITSDTANITGNLTTGNANLGNLVTANYGNFNNDLVVQGNIANANNISVTNILAAGSANITNDLVVQGNIANANNISVTNNITAGSANVSNDLDVGGNIVTGTGSGGNISGVNYLTANIANISDVVNTGEIANGTSNIRLAQDSNVTISVNNTSNVFTFSDAGANVIGYIQANGVISAGGFVGSNLVSNVGILSLQAQQVGGNYNINLLAGGNGNIDVGSTYITSVRDPSNPQDAATKAYVDLVAQGLHVHAPANLATSTDLANTLGIDPANVVYNQPGPQGVGATLTFTGNTLTQLDSTPVTANMRLLIKNESNAVWNGVYFITSDASFITRTTDEDNNADFAGGDFLFVESGTQFADTGWVQTTDNVVIGTSNIVFSQFSGAGTYTGANGISVVGTLITANVDNTTTAIIGGNIAVKDGAVLNYPNIGAATGTSLDLTGNVLAGNLNSNATITTVDLNATGNVLANNVTANSTVYTIDLSATGNVLAGNLNANTTVTTIDLSATGNVLAGNINSNAFITAVDGNLTGNLTVGGNITTTGATGNISGANVIFANSFTSNGGVVDFNTNNANVQLGNIGNVHIYGGTTNQVLTTDGSGNLAWSSGSQVANGTSSVSIPVADGNINMSVGGNANILVVTGTGANVTGTLDVTGNITGNVLIANSLTSTRVPYVGSSNNLTDTSALIWDNPNQVLKVGAGGTELGGDSGYGYVQTSTANVATQIKLGNTAVNWATVTTTSVSANQTIASYSVTGVTGIEFLVKAVDSGGKYSIATVQAVTDGTNVDYATFGTVQLGGYTGSLAVNVVGGFVRLQVTPSSGNSTVWTTQYRLI